MNFSEPIFHSHALYILSGHIPTSHSLSFIRFYNQRAIWAREHPSVHFPLGRVPRRPVAEPPSFGPPRVVPSALASPEPRAGPPETDERLARANDGSAASGRRPVVSGQGHADWPSWLVPCTGSPSTST